MVKPIVILHVTIIACILFLFLFGELLRFYVWRGCPHLEPRLVTLLNEFPIAIGLDSWRPEREIVAWLLGAVGMVFALALLSAKLTLDKVSTPTYTYGVAFLMFVSTVKMNNFEVSLIMLLFQDASDCFNVLLSIAFSFILWLMASIIIIVGFLSDLGWSEEAMMEKLDPILVYSGGSAVFFAFVTTIVNSFL